MFNLQWPHIDAMLEAGDMPEDQRLALRELGNCLADIQHNGPVSLDTGDQFAGAAVLNLLSLPSFELTAATLKVRNYASRIDGNQIFNGLGLLVDGVSVFLDQLVPLGGIDLTSSTELVTIGSGGLEIVDCGSLTMTCSGVDVLLFDLTAGTFEFDDSSGNTILLIDTTTGVVTFGEPAGNPVMTVDTSNWTVTIEDSSGNTVVNVDAETGTVDITGAGGLNLTDCTPLTIECAGTTVFDVNPTAGTFVLRELVVTFVDSGGNTLLTIDPDNDTLSYTSAGSVPMLSIDGTTSTISLTAVVDFESPSVVTLKSGTTTTFDTGAQFFVGASGMTVTDGPLIVTNTSGGDVMRIEGDNDQILALAPFIVNDGTSDLLELDPAGKTATLKNGMNLILECGSGISILCTTGGPSGGISVEDGDITTTNGDISAPGGTVSAPAFSVDGDTHLLPAISIGKYASAATAISGTEATVPLNSEPGDSASEQDVAYPQTGTWTITTNGVELPSTGIYEFNISSSAGWDSGTTVGAETAIELRIYVEGALMTPVASATLPAWVDGRANLSFSGLIAGQAGWEVLVKVVRLAQNGTPIGGDAELVAGGTMLHLHKVNNSDIV